MPSRPRNAANAATWPSTPAPEAGRRSGQLRSPVLLGNQFLDQLRSEHHADALAAAIAFRSLLKAALELGGDGIEVGVVIQRGVVRVGHGEDQVRILGTTRRHLVHLV